MIWSVSGEMGNSLKIFKYGNFLRDKKRSRHAVMAMPASFHGMRKDDSNAAAVSSSEHTLRLLQNL